MGGGKKGLGTIKKERIEEGGQREGEVVGRPDGSREENPPFVLSPSSFSQTNKNGGEGALAAVGGGGGGELESGKRGEKGVVVCVWTRLLLKAETPGRRRPHASTISTLAEEGGGLPHGSRIHMKERKGFFLLALPIKWQILHFRFPSLPPLSLVPNGPEISVPFLPPFPFPCREDAPPLHKSVMLGTPSLGLFLSLTRKSDTPLRCT